VETYIAPKGLMQCKRCQRFGRKQRYCGYATRRVTCGEAHLSGECSTSQQQLNCCTCGGNHTVKYRDCAKGKEAKAELAKRTPVKRSKVCGAPSPSTAPQAKREEPSAEQESLGLDWNHVLEGRVVKAATPPIPLPLPAQSLKILLGIK